MIKEAILFVVATGVLIYFVTPSDEPPETGAVSEDTQKPVIRTPKTTDDGWGYDDEEEDDDGESFVFGEPLTNLDGDYGDKSSDDELEKSSDNRDQTETRETPTKPVTKSRQKFSANSPMPSEPGGVDNPIIFTPK